MSEKTVATLRVQGFIPSAQYDVNTQKKFIDYHVQDITKVQSDIKGKSPAVKNFTSTVGVPNVSGLADYSPIHWVESDGQAYFGYAIGGKVYEVGQLKERT